MSHFTVLVIGNNPEKQLAPFDENLTMPRYVEYTKDQLIEKGKKWIEDYKNGTYAEFIANPEGYKSKVTNQGHIDYLENEFPKKLNWTDEQVYDCEIEDYEKSDITPDGGVYSTYNPNSKWDWYQLGGRWTGSLLLKDGMRGREGTPSLVSTVRCKPGYADAAYKSDIDFEGMRNLAEVEAKEKYKLAMAILEGKPVNNSWDAVLKEHGATVGRDIYWAQDRCIAWKAASADKDFPFSPFSSSPDDFLITEEQYIQNARNNAFVMFALLKDGKWYEKGKMGWWAMVSNEKDQQQWATEFNKLIDELPEETFISVYDCHI